MTTEGSSRSGVAAVAAVADAAATWRWSEPPLPTQPHQSGAASTVSGHSVAGPAAPFGRMRGKSRSGGRISIVVATVASPGSAVLLPGGARDAVTSSGSNLGRSGKRVANVVDAAAEATPPLPSSPSPAGVLLAAAAAGGAAKSSSPTQTPPNTASQAPPGPAAAAEAEMALPAQC